MKFEKSATLPTFSESIVATSSSFMFVHRLCGTYARDAAEHFWP